jgi:hypothetical protein
MKPQKHSVNWAVQMKQQVLLATSDPGGRAV